MFLLIDTMTRENNSNIPVSDINEQSIISTVQFLNSKLEKYFRLQQQTVLLEALKDIDAAQTEPIQNALIDEYKVLLENEKEIKFQLKQRPFYLERLQSMSRSFTLHILSQKFKVFPGCDTGIIKGKGELSRNCTFKFNWKQLHHNLLGLCILLSRCCDPFVYRLA